MTRGKRIGVFGLCLLVAAGLFVPQFMWATMPTTAPAATQRSADAIYNDLQTTDAQIHALLPSPALLADESYRKGDGQKLMAPLRQMAGLFAEMAANGCNPDGYINLDSITKDLGFFRERGVLEGNITAEEITDYSFVEKALAVLGPYHRRQ